MGLRGSSRMTEYDAEFRIVMQQFPLSKEKTYKPYTRMQRLPEGSDGVLVQQQTGYFFACINKASVMKYAEEA